MNGVWLGARQIRCGEAQNNVRSCANRKREREREKIQRERARARIYRALLQMYRALLLIDELSGDPHSGMHLLRRSTE